MSIKDFLSRLLDTKTNAGRIIMPYQSNMPQYLPNNFRDLATGGYSQNEIVYACLQLRANALAEAPMNIADPDGEIIPNHPLHLLIKKPNPFLTETQLWLLSSLYLDISGNCFWEKVRSASGRVVELWPLRPDRMEIEPDADKFIRRYWYKIGSLKYPIEPEDIIHFKSPDPLNDYFGMAPLRAGLRAVSIDNEANDFTKVMLQNYAIPPVAVMMEGKVDEENSRRLLTSWKQKFGKDNRGDPMFAGGIKDIKTLGMSLADMTLPDLRSISESRICMIFNVQPILIGAKVGLDRSTFANFSEARQVFQQDCMGPLRRIYADTIDRYLLTDFESDESYTAKFDISNVAALADIKERKYIAMTAAVTAGWVQVNEARKEVGLNPDPNGDVYLRGLTMMTVPAGKGTKALPCGCGSEHKAIPKVEKKEGFELLRLVLGRLSIADKFADKIKDLSQAEFAIEAQEVLQIYAREAKAIDKYAADNIIFEVTKKGRAWQKRVFETALPVLKALTAESALLAAAELGISFNIESETALNFVQSYNYKFAASISDTSVSDMKTIIDGALRDGLSINEAKEQLLTKFVEWEKTRAEMVARTEVIRGSNMGAKMAYKEAGITRLRWVAAADHCDYCAGLDGKIVGIDENFQNLGDSVSGGSGDAPMAITYDNIETPPLHVNCRCTILAD